MYFLVGCVVSQSCTALHGPKLYSWTHCGQHHTIHIVRCSVIPPANKLFSLRGFEYLVVWDDLSAVGVVLLAAYIRHLVREQLFFSPLPIISQPTCMSTAVYCCLISHLGEGVVWIIFTTSVVPATVFSEKNVHNSLIDGKRYCLVPCDVQLQRDTSGCIFLPFHLRGFAGLCKKTRWSPYARIVLLWLCFHSLCSPKDWICTQFSMHVISCFPQMWAQQNNMCDPSVWIPW